MESLIVQNSVLAVRVETLTKLNAELTKQLAWKESPQNPGT